MKVHLKQGVALFPGRTLKHCLRYPRRPGPPVRAPIGSQPHNQPPSTHPQGGPTPATRPSAPCPRPGTAPDAHLGNHPTTAHVCRLL